MAKPNYQHLKKQRDLARKKKQEEKRRQRHERKEQKNSVITEPQPT
jgi:hypothetical protein